MLSNKQTKLNTAILLIALAAVVFISPVAAEEPDLPEEFQLSGTIEGMGAYFEITDSEYLNITFESTEPVHLRLESAPKMVVMHLEAAEGATSAQITLGGFEAETTYYMYEDNYHNLTELTTDENGSYSYTQDLTERHLVFIQPEPSTIFLSDSGWSDTTVGTWDPVTKTGTLTQNVSETIQIDSDGVTLDGNDFSVINSGYSYGVFLNGRTGVTITNITVEGFYSGIYLNQSSNNTLTNNTALNNSKYGIRLVSSSSNTLTGNTASNNQVGISLGGSSNANTLTGNTVSNHWALGIQLSSSSNNTLTGNKALNNGVGIWVYFKSRNNTLTGNTTNYNNTGIYIQHYSTNNTITGNTTNSNSNIGIYLYSSCNANTLTGNTSLNNTHGIHIYRCSNNTLTGNTVALNSYGLEIVVYSYNNLICNNNLIDNTLQARVYTNSTGNVFNLDAPTGGNYWSDWTGPDVDGDGFVDSAYVFSGGQDNLPLVDPFGPVALMPTWPVGSALATSDIGLADLTLTWTAAAHEVGIAGYQLYQDDVLIDNVTVGQLSYDVIGLEYFTEYTFKVEACNLLGSCTTDGPSVTVTTLTPVEAIEKLAADVLALNIQNGISNSLDAKLDAVLRALDDVNQNNDAAAVNALQAFINAVQAQRGGKISVEDADSLIATAQAAIDALNAP